MFSAEQLVRVRAAVANQNARAKKHGCDGRIHWQDWVSLCEQHQHKCVLCGASKWLAIDHIEPLSRGGANTIENVQPVCMSCNSKKGNRAGIESDGMLMTLVSCSIAKLYEMDAICQAYGISRTEAVREAVTQWIARQYTVTGGNFNGRVRRRKSNGTLEDPEEVCCVET